MRLTPFSSVVNCHKIWQECRNTRIPQTIISLSNSSTLVFTQNGSPSNLIVTEAYSSVVVTVKLDHHSRLLYPYSYPYVVYTIFYTVDHSFIYATLSHETTIPSTTRPQLTQPYNIKSALSTLCEFFCEEVLESPLSNDGWIEWCLRNLQTEFGRYCLIS